MGKTRDATEKEKTHKEEVIPECLLVRGMQNLIQQYVNDDIIISENSKRYLFFGEDPSIVIDAKRIAHEHIFTDSPMNKICEEISATPKVLLVTLKTTLSIAGEEVTVEGNLLGLCRIFLKTPIEKLQQLRQQKFPAIVDQTESKSTPINANLNETLNRVCSLVRGHSKQAETIIKTSIRDMRPTVITTDEYFLLILQFLNDAAYRFKARAGSPSIWGPQQIIQFFLKILKTIENSLPLGIRNTLEERFSCLMEREESINTTIKCPWLASPIRACENYIRVLDEIIKEVSPSEKIEHGQDRKYARPG